MTEKSKTPEKAAESGPAAPWANAELQKMGFGPIAWMGVEWCNCMTEMGSELMQFVADRIKEDVKIQHEILNAKDVGQVQEIQTRFMTKAFDQYAAETGKLIEMSSDMIARTQSKTN